MAAPPCRIFRIGLRTWRLRPRVLLGDLLHYFAMFARWRTYRRGPPDEIVYLVRADVTKRFPITLDSIPRPAKRPVASFASRKRRLGVLFRF